MGRLSTHVLDTVTGKPAAGVRIDLALHDGAGYRTLKTVRTNADGRTDEPLLSGDALKAARYELTFHVAEYFSTRDLGQTNPPFLDPVPLRFGTADPQGPYHVPQLAS